MVEESVEFHKPDQRTEEKDQHRKQPLRMWNQKFVSSGRTAVNTAREGLVYPIQTLIWAKGQEQQ